jgi:hypothetical protein
VEIQEVVRQFADDKQLHAVIVLIALDLIVGVIAAVRTGQFAFSKVAAFLKDDVLGKVLPWFAVFATAKFAPSVEVLGVDLNAIQTGLWVAVSAALAFSLMASIEDLGLGKTLPKALTTGENQGVAPKPSG